MKIRKHNIPELLSLIFTVLLSSAIRLASSVTSTSFALSFPIGLGKTESAFIVRSVETGLRRYTLVGAVISVDAYPFLAFSDLTCHPEDTGIGILWLHCAA